MAYTAGQVMMTLAALAYTHETTNKNAGETLPQQEQRILADLNNNAACGLKQVPTTSDWTAIWVGLSSDPERSNMAYIAQRSVVANTYCVALRGSDFGLFTDALQDFSVGDRVSFMGGGQIAQGASDAFTKVTDAQYMPGGAGWLEGTNMLAALIQHVVDAAPSQPVTIDVTGHSLGALATTVSLFLQGQSWSKQVIFQVHTFAAPTAGDGAFANASDAAFPGTSLESDSSWRVYNVYDVVPNARQTLDIVSNTYYPHPPGPGATVAVS